MCRLLTPKAVLHFKIGPPIVPLDQKMCFPSGVGYGLIHYDLATSEWRFPCGRNEWLYPGLRHEKIHYKTSKVSGEFQKNWLTSAPIHSYVFCWLKSGLDFWGCLRNVWYRVVLKKCFFLIIIIRRNTQDFRTKEKNGFWMWNQTPPEGWPVWKCGQGSWMKWNDVNNLLKVCTWIMQICFLIWSSYKL